MNNIWNFLDNYSFGIVLNANDIFGYACADAVNVDLLDFPKLLQIEKKYGNDGVIAFMSKIYKIEPLKELKTKEYEQAKTELNSYILFEDLELDDIDVWNNWWKEYENLTSMDKSGEYLK